MPQNQENIQQCTYHASSNVFSFFFYFSAPPPADVHSLPLQKITTYMSTFLEVDNWTEAHYQALKPCMELYFLLLILLLVPTLISGFKKYEYCKIEQEKRCQSKWCLQQQEFMSHGTHFILSFFGETYCISPLAKIWKESVKSSHSSDFMTNVGESHKTWPYLTPNSTEKTFWDST